MTALAWIPPVLGFPGGSAVKNPLASAGDAGLIPRLGKFPAGGTGNPLQYPCLGNPMDRGAWRVSLSPEMLLGAPRRVQEQGKIIMRNGSPRSHLPIGHLHPDVRCIQAVSQDSGACHPLLPLNRALPCMEYYGIIKNLTLELNDISFPPEQLLVRIRTVPSIPLRH